MDDAQQRSFRASDTPRDPMSHLLNSVIVPRPIAWVTSRSIDGVVNLAPHSYTTVACVAPPMLLFTSVREKDTARNIRATREFVVNIVGHELVEQMNVTATDAPPHISEVELAGLTTAPSSTISVPRIAEAKVAIECSLDRIVELGPEPSLVVFGRVEVLHAAESLFDERDRIDPERLDAVARMGGSLYSTTRDRFELRRPKYADLVEETP